MKDSLTVMLAIVGTLLAYVSAPGQRWLRAPLPARPARSAAAACVFAAFAFGIRTSHPATALALVLTVAMACLTVSPFVGVLVERLRTRSARHGA